MSEPTKQSDELHAQIQYRLVERLAASERRYRELLSALQEIVISVDMRGRIAFVSAAWSRILGHPAEDVVERPFLSFVAEDHFEHIMPPELEGKGGSLTVGTSIDIQIPLRHQHGGVVHFAFSGRVTDDLEVVGTLYDVTGRLLEGRARALGALEHLLQNASVAVFSVDTAGMITKENQVFLDLAARSGHSEPLRVMDVFGGSDASRLLSAVRLVCGGGTPRDIELGVARSTGELRQVILNMWPRRDARDDVVGVWCVGHDVSELRRHQERLEYLVDRRTDELSHALNRAKALNSMKDDFVKNVSHEFRTPLAQIQLAAGILRDHGEKLSVEQSQNRLTKVDEAVSRMTYLLDEILVNNHQLSRPQDQTLEYVALKEYCANTLASMSAAFGHRVDLKTIFEGLDDPIFTDLSLVDRIFRYLVESAWERAFEAAPILIRCTREGVVLTMGVSVLGELLPDDEIKVLTTPMAEEGSFRVPHHSISTSIAVYAAEQLEGHFEVSTDQGGVTHLSFRMPLRDKPPK